MKILRACLIIIVILFNLCNISFSQINTVAGNGTNGYTGDGGPPLNAQISKPTELAFDGVGNYYFVDYEHNRIRKINTTTNIISTVAGNGQGFCSCTPVDGKLGTEISISPSSYGGIACDNQGNILFPSGNKVLKMDKSSLIISTVAGNGFYGHNGDGGQATQAKITPSYLTVDKNGNIYIVETDNHYIRKIDASTNIITTIAGKGYLGYEDGGLAVDAVLGYPKGIAIDDDGNIYFADYNISVIRRIDAVTKIINTIAGFGSSSLGNAGDGGPAKDAYLLGPTGIALDANRNLYITEPNRHRVRVIDANTKIISTIAGKASNTIADWGFSGDGGPATEAKFYYPNGVSIDNFGNLFIADTENNRLRKITKQNQSITFTSIAAKVFSDQPFNLNATATSSLPVTYSSSNSLVATIENNTVTIKGVGTTVITAYQTGNNNYFAATPVNKDFTVNKASQAITFPVLLDKTFGDVNFSLSATSTSIHGDLNNTA